MTSNDDNKDQPRQKLISTAESAWFAKVNAGDLSGQTNQEFLEWLERNSANEQNYEKCELIWELCGELEHDPEIAAAIAACDEEIRIRTEAQSSRSAFSADRTSRLQRLLIPLRSKVGMLAMAAAVLLAIWIPQMPLTYDTEIGERRSVTLADGSSVTLNTDTELVVRFQASQRDIELKRGEAIFNVAHDADRPFVVHAAHGTARAVGTRFNVLLEQDQVTVSVLEGSVAVRSRVTDRDTSQPGAEPAPAANVKLLKVGEAVNYWEEGTISEPRKARLGRIDAWQQGKLEFDSDSLASVIKEHNRYALKKIVIADDDLNKIQVSGVFNANDTKSLLFALQEAFGIRAVHRQSMILLIPES